LALACGKQLQILRADGTLAARGAALESTISDLCWYPLGPMVLTASYGGLQAWDAAQAEKCKIYEWKGALWNCAWSPDGRWIAAGSQENAMHVWDAGTGEHLHMPGYQGKIRAVDWSPDGRWLGTGNGSDVLLWDCSGKGPGGTRPLMYGVHSEAVSVIQFQKPGPVFAVAGRDGKIALWQSGGGEEPLAVYVGTEEVCALRWSPDGKLLAAGTSSGVVMVF